MSEFNIHTPHGINLVGDLIRPVDSKNAVVIMVHGFLSNRNGNSLLEGIGKALRRRGYATCCVDLSGCGSSDTVPITVESQTLDLRAVSSWLAEQGLTQQAVFAIGFGAKVALSARPRHVKAIACIYPYLAPRSYDWAEIFSEQQLEELDRTGQCFIDDDTNKPRCSHLISRQTLNDISHTDATKLLESQLCPVLLFIADDEEHADERNACADAFGLLPNGSRTTFVCSPALFTTENGIQPPPEFVSEIAEIYLNWLATRVSPH